MALHKRKQNYEMPNHEKTSPSTADEKDFKVNKKEQSDFVNFLTRPTDSSRLAVFRILFGACMAWHIIRAMDQGVLDANFGEIFPEIHFHYYFAQDIGTPHRSVVAVIFYICAVSAVFLSLGCFYRISSLSFLVSFSYINMLEKARYNNHYYFYILLAFLFLMTDSHKIYSIDSFVKSYFKRNRNEERLVPIWQIYLFRFQVFVCYFYSGIAKINKDWLLRGEPCHIWFHRVPQICAVAEYIVGKKYAAVFLGHNFCIMGFLFDFTIGFLLLSTTFRAFGFLMTTVFHLTNHFVFTIGTFPWTMLATNVLFLNEETFHNIAWHFRSITQNVLFQCRIYFKKIKGNTHVSTEKVTENETIHGKNSQNSSINKPNNDKICLEKVPRNEKNKIEVKTVHEVTKIKVGVLVCYVLVQLLVPFRHWLYPGDVNWTMEGHQFSWRMMLNEEDVLLRMLVRPGKDKHEFPHDDYQMNARQLKRMITDPELILQYAHHVGKRFQEGEELANVRVDMWRSLNKRPFQRWIKPSVNLAAERYTLSAYPWLEEQISDEYFDFTQLQEIRNYWKEHDKELSFFIQRPGEIFKNFLKFDHCSNVTLLTVTGDIQVRMKKMNNTVTSGIELLIIPGKFHYVETLTTFPTVWAYVHDCPKAYFHLSMMMTSLDSWQIL